jgi:hypothetical protein
MTQTGASRADEAWNTFRPPFTRRPVSAAATMPVVTKRSVLRRREATIINGRIISHVMSRAGRANSS